MLDSKQSKIFAAVAGSVLIGKLLFRPTFDQLFLRKCFLCGEPITISRHFFRWTHSPGWTCSSDIHFTFLNLEWFYCVNVAFFLLGTDFECLFFKLMTQSGLLDFFGCVGRWRKKISWAYYLRILLGAQFS